MAVLVHTIVGDSACRRGRRRARAARRRIRRRATCAVTILAAAGVLFSACSDRPSLPSTAPLTSTGTATPDLTKAIHELNAGMDAQAVADFLRIVKVEPKNQIAWYDLGVIAQQRGQTAQAEHDYRSSIAGDATYVPAIYNLAVLEAPTAPSTAETLYQLAIKLQPNNADAHLNLGFVLQQLGQPAAGGLQLARAVKLDPSLASRIPTTTTGG
jgi:Tfp pilus assembly protein PilF